LVPVFATERKPSTSLEGENARAALRDLHARAVSGGKSR
jgi:hypothetical protein